MAKPDARDLLRRYEDAKSARSPHENDWRMASAYCLPRHYNAWQTNGPAAYSANGAAAARRFAFDNTGVNALPKYVSVLMRLLTPTNMRYHKLAPSNTDLLKSRAVRVYFDTLTDMLFKHRYQPKAKFVQSNSEVYASLGVYGTGPKFVGQRPRSSLDVRGGIMYRACPLRDIFVLVNDEGDVDTVFRRFFLTARNFKRKFPQAEPPKLIKAELEKPTPSDTKHFELVHVVHPRDDYDPKRIDVGRFAYAGYYLSVEDAEYVGDEEGFRSMPYLTPRTFTEAGDAYGYSPAMQALPALGSVSAIKKTLLKQGQKAVDPVLLAHDDGVMNGGMDLRPGAVNFGGVDAQGRKLVTALESGNFQVGEKMLQDERQDINDSFFVTLFQILTETPEMTATEVIERVAEKASLLAPTMGRLQTEYLGPQIERELDLMDELGFLNNLEVPPELIEAEGEYDVVYTSPLAKGMYAEETSGFMRVFEMAMGAAQATGDPSALDHFDLDVAIPEMADRMSAPPRWMRDPKAVEALRADRAKQAQERMMVENAPGLAGAAKVAGEMGMLGDSTK